MSVKVIQITIPSENILPDIINSFSPEENYQMLKIGCETLNEGRKSIANLTSNQIFKKVESEFKKEIDKLNMDIVIEKNTSISINERMVKMYETQIEKLNFLILELKLFEEFLFELLTILRYLSGRQIF